MTTSVVVVMHNHSNHLQAPIAPEPKSPPPSVAKPRNPHVNTRSASTESNATSTTSLMSVSDRMDWTISSHHGENTDRSNSDGDEETERLCGALMDSKMMLVREDEPAEQFAAASTEAPFRKSCVEFMEETIVHELKPELQPDESVPTSVQIHRAYPPMSPSTRVRKSVGGTLHRQVSFHQVQIRRYPMIAGDNPACQMGTPVQLDWGYEELPALDLDDFEATRSQTRRRKLHHLILNYFQRNRILLGIGYTEEEIKQLEKEVSKERFRREVTKMVVPFWKIEDCVQSVRRKVKRRMNKEENEKKDELERTIRMLREQDATRL